MKLEDMRFICCNKCDNPIKGELEWVDTCICEATEDLLLSVSKPL